MLLNISASSLVVSADSYPFAAHTGVVPTSGSSVIDPFGRLWFLGATWSGSEPNIHVQRCICTVDTTSPPSAPARCEPSNAMSLAWAGGDGSGTMLGFDRGNATTGVTNINRLCSFGASGVREEVLCNFTGTDVPASPYFVSGDELVTYRAAAGGGGGHWLGAFGSRPTDSTGQLRLLTVEVPAVGGAARVTADPKFCGVESLQTNGPPCPRVLW